MPCIAQKRAKAPLAKFVPLSVMMLCGMPYRMVMSEMKVTAVGPFQLLDWFCFYPLGELVHYDKQMSHATSCCFEWSHHVQAPGSKGPGNGDSLQCRSRLMWLGAELLAPFAFLDQVFGVFQSSRPEKTVAKSFGDKCS